MKKIFTLFAIGAALIFAGQAAAADKILVSPQIEAEQLAILRSDAPPGQKAIACKKLAIDGSSAAVPELAKLLSNPELSSWARIALEAIPGAEADLALRTAAGSLDTGLVPSTTSPTAYDQPSKTCQRMSAPLSVGELSTLFAAVGQVD